VPAAVGAGGWARYGRFIRTSGSSCRDRHAGQARGAEKGPMLRLWPLGESEASPRVSNRLWSAVQRTGSRVERHPGNQPHGGGRVHPKRLRSSYLNRWDPKSDRPGLCGACSRACGHRAKVRSAPVNHVDETSWQQNGAIKWLWTMTNCVAAFFMVHSKRSRKAFEALIENWRGILVSDNYGCLPQLGQSASSVPGAFNPQSQRTGRKNPRELPALRGAVERGLAAVMRFCPCPAG